MGNNVPPFGFEVNKSEFSVLLSSKGVIADSHPKDILHRATASGSLKVSLLVTRCPYKQRQAAPEGYYVLEKKTTNP